jgi:hypothetical protein
MSTCFPASDVTQQATSLLNLQKGSTNDNKDSFGIGIGEIK